MIKLQEPKSILIVEDDSPLAQNIAMQLAELGYGVVCILATGEEAIAQIDLLKPDLILMDIMLAGKLDGIETARQIQLVRRAPVVFLTAYADQELARRALSSGPFAYLQKPMKERELELTLELVLLRHSMEEQDRVTHMILEQRISKSHQELVSARQNLEEMKIAQQRNQSALRRFSDAMDVSSDSIFLIDRSNMRFIDVNETACERTGFSRDELLDMGPHDIKPDFTRQILEYQFDRIAATRERFGIINTVHRCKNNELFPVEVRLRALEADERPIMVAIARDMSLRHQREQALRLSEEKFRMLFEHSPIGMALIGDNFRLNEINTAFCDMLGYSKTELLGKSIQDITHHEDLNVTLQHTEKLFNQYESKFIKENRYIRKNGDIIWGRLHSTIVRDQNQQPLFGLGMIEDIDHIKQAEAVRLNHGAAQKKALVREVHHRIKNHLQGVVGLMQQYAQDMQADKQCSSIIGAAIAQINVVATIHGLQGSESSEDIDLLQMLTTISRSVTELDPSRPVLPVKSAGNLSLYLNREESVPVALALNELIINAIKHGTGPVEISLDCSSDHALVCIANQCCSAAKNISPGSGLGLVQALLQTQGAAFTYEQNGQRFLSRILLAAPVIQLHRLAY